MLQRVYLQQPARAVRQRYAHDDRPLPRMDSVQVSHGSQLQIKTQSVHLHEIRGSQLQLETQSLSSVSLFKTQRS